MTAVSAASARNPGWVRPLRAIVGYTLRTSLPGKRRVGILLPCAAAILFGILSAGLEGIATEQFADMASVALFALVLPVTCLVIGDAVLGAEIRSGVFAFTWLSPLPTWQIVVGRWIGGSLVAVVCVAVAFAASAVVAGAGAMAGPIALAGAFGAATYIAVFLAIGCLVRRAAVWSLAFVFLVERLLGAALSGIAQLSPAWVSKAVFVDFADAQESLERSGVPHGTAGLVRLAVITAVVLLLASLRLRRLRIEGSAD